MYIYICIHTHSISHDGMAHMLSHTFSPDRGRPGGPRGRAGAAAEGAPSIRGVIGS